MLKVSRIKKKRFLKRMHFVCRLLCLSLLLWINLVPFTHLFMFSFSMEISFIVYRKLALSFSKELRSCLPRNKTVMSG